ncbi:MAG: T9SS type A sorting domain-containing protein [Mariniphaga sp.]|nr:T9SS type A sorting domain-containing protein [Mariniphaga sp.]
MKQIFIFTLLILISLSGYSREIAVNSVNYNSSEIFVLQIEGDTIDPTASNPEPITVECYTDATPDANVVTDEADNSNGSLTVAWVSDVSDGNICHEIITRTFSVTDESGNQISVTQTITVDDTINPTASNPEPIIVGNIENVPEADISVVADEADNCTANPIVEFIGFVSDGNTNPEIITRTYSVTDDCGNQILVTQTITIDETNFPTASNPDPVTVECIGDVPAADIRVVTDEADDNTANPIVAFVSDVSDGTTCPETIIRTYSVKNDSGYSIQVTQIITVNDITPPTASNLSPITVKYIGDVPAPDVTIITDEADNCTANPIVEFVSDVSDGHTNPEIITRTYSVTDDCGNSIIVTQTITIDDTSYPTASNPDPITVECISDVPSPDVTVVTDEADSSNGTLTVSFVGDVWDGSTCPTIITRTYSVSNESGNSISVTQIITVNDITLPIVTSSPVINIDCIADMPGVHASWASFTSAGGNVFDNCGIDTASFSFVSVVSDNNMCPEIITATYQISDLCGNTTNISQIVVINDLTPPVIACPNNFEIAPTDTIPDAYNSAELFIAEGGFLSDNCEVDLYSFNLFSQTSADFDNSILLTRTYSISDFCGNLTTCEQDISVLKPSTVFSDVLPAKFNYSIIPNPNNGVFSIRFDTNLKKKISLKLVNSLGQIIETRNVKAVTFDRTKQFNVSHLSKGFYYLDISFEEFHRSEKIVVQ